MQQTLEPRLAKQTFLKDLDSHQLEQVAGCAFDVRFEAGQFIFHEGEAAKQPIPRTMFNCSTHDLGVAEAIELARAFGKLPPRLIVYGIEGRDFDEGTG